jgi:RNA polymerase sigma factor (sigma-70 family)
VTEVDQDRDLDLDLVREALEGRAGAFEDLVRRWTPRILAVCHAKVGRSGLAEDLAQEALLRGFRGLRTLKDPAKFGPWLKGIALRACLDWLKAKERTQVNFSELGGARPIEEVLGGRSGEPELERDEEMRKVMAEVQALDEEHREVLMLFYYQEKKHRDIAGILGVSAATVNARLARARAILRRRLNGVNE